MPLRHSVPATQSHPNPGSSAQSISHPEQRNFPRDDQFFRKVKRAHDALHDLFLECHELGTSGTGRKLNKDV